MRGRASVLSLLFALVIVVSTVAVDTGVATASGTTTTVLTVDANPTDETVDWFDDNYWTPQNADAASGVRVKKGSTVTISAFGTWSHDQHVLYGPDGTTSKNSICYPGFVHGIAQEDQVSTVGRLIARIVDPEAVPVPGGDEIHGSADQCVNNYDPISVGSGITFVAAASGVLQFSINDDTAEQTGVRFSDNRGSVTVTVMVQQGGAPGKVTICHKPGTPAEQTLVVAERAWSNGHQKHGDTLGACP